MARKYFFFNFSNLFLIILKLKPSRDEGDFPCMDDRYEVA
jgi:hypothetical protein